MCICTNYEQNITKKLTQKIVSRTLIIGSVRTENFVEFSALKMNKK